MFFTLRSFVQTLALSAVVVCLATPVAAQVTAAGADTTRSQTGQNVTVAGSIFGGYDTDVTGSALDPSLQVRGSQLGSTLSLNYRARSERIGISTKALADSRLYRANRSLNGTSFTGSVDFGAKVTNRFRVDGSFTGSYFPQFQFSALPVPVGVPAGQPPTLSEQSLPLIEQTSTSIDYAISINSAISYDSIGNATYKLSKRSAIRGTYGKSYYKFVDYTYAMPTRTVGGLFTYQFTRYATLRLGSTEQKTEYPTFVGLERRTVRNRLIDVGVNYSRPLSVSRRAVLSFGTGSGAVDNGIEKFYTVLGNASLEYQLARRWNLEATYARGLDIVGGFTDPFFADSVIATIHGGFGRLLMTSTAGFATGSVGMGSHANDYSSTQAATRFEVRLKPRRVALFGSYFYYGYSFAEPVRIASGSLPRQVGRHGVRGGLTIRVPLVQERTTSVTR